MILDVPLRFGMGFALGDRLFDRDDEKTIERKGHGFLTRTAAGHREPGRAATYLQTGGVFKQGSGP